PPLGGCEGTTVRGNMKNRKRRGSAGSNRTVASPRITTPRNCAATPLPEIPQARICIDPRCALRKSSPISRSTVGLRRQFPACGPLRIWLGPRAAPERQKRRNKSRTQRDSPRVRFRQCCIPFSRASPLHPPFGLVRIARSLRYGRDPGHRRAVVLGLRERTGGSGNQGTGVGHLVPTIPSPVRFIMLVYGIVGSMRSPQRRPQPCPPAIPICR